MSCPDRTHLAVYSLECRTDNAKVRREAQVVLEKCPRRKRAGGPHNRGRPIQSRSVRLSGVSIHEGHPGTSFVRHIPRISVTCLALRIQVPSGCAVPSEALLQHKAFKFITCSCYRRQPLLGTTERRDLFPRNIGRSEQARIRCQVSGLGCQEGQKQKNHAAPLTRRS